MTVTQPAPGSALSTAAAQWGAAAMATGSLSYDPTKFYCKATDVKGHGERVGFKVPPDVYAQVMKMVYSNDFPDYESPPDFFRDAAVHLLAKRRDQITDPRMREVIEEILHRLAYDEFVAKIEAESVNWERSHDKLREVLTRLSHDGAWGQIVAHLQSAEEMLDPAPEPYRSRGMAVLDEWHLRVPKEFLIDP